MKTRNLKSKAVVGQVGIHALLKKILLFIFLLVGIHANAQTIELNGKIEDAFLKIPLDNVKVSLLTADSTVIVKEAELVRFLDTKGKLLFVYYKFSVAPKEETYLIHATLPGYTEAWKKVEVTDISLKEIEAGTLKLRKSMDQTLAAATVVATKVKMCYKGDTLVYNADAFKLPDGSMLDGLIRQLPGVKLTDAGEIFVNGRKVDELLLGSRVFMRGNKKVLMENLPYFTVKDIKVYDKQSAKSEALGYDVDSRSFVMDVNLKKEYKKGYIANMEAAAGTEKRWLGRAFLLGYTDRLRLSLYGNLNNVNETRHIGEMGYWTPANAPRSLTTTRSAKAELDFQSQNKNLKENLFIDYTSATERAETRSRYERFLFNQTPVSRSESRSRLSNQSINLSNEVELTKPFYFNMISNFDWSTFDGNSSYLFDERNDSLITSQRSRGINEGKNWGTQHQISGSFNINKEKQRNLDFNGFFSYNSSESDRGNQYATQSFNIPNHTIQNNANDISNKNWLTSLGFSYNHSVSKKVTAGIGESVTYYNSKTHDYLYHPDSLLLPSQIDALKAFTDWNNSYKSHEKNITNSVSLSLYGNGYYQSSPNSIYRSVYHKWYLSVNLPIFHSTLDYQRGVLDTLVKQNYFPFSAEAKFREVWKNGKRKLWYGAKYATNHPNSYDLITYRDDSQPLIIKLGNPDLKGRSKTNVYAKFEDKTGKHMQQYHAALSFDYHHRDVAQSVSYNNNNGVYTYQPQNIHGSYYANAKFDFSRAIDKKQNWNWQTNFNANYAHNIDHTMLEGENESHKNMVNTLSLGEGAWIQFRKKSFYIRARADFSWRHSEGKMRDFETLNAFDFQYGVNGNYTIPVIKTTIALDGNMYSRRGYGSSALNTDDFVLNASLSQSFLKGKLIARVEGFDLLHQISSTQYAVNAQGRTETWYRSLPRYVMFHLVYHWNKNPKKR